jgi:uncharacterized protein (TIGR01244 family)
MEPAEIPNYRLVAPGLATAGKPSPAVLPSLKTLGFKTVVDLRTEKEGTREEEAAVKAAGLRYVWVPITAESFSLEDVRAVASVLDDPEAGPILLHCTSANRVGAVWAVLQARKGKSLEEAEAEGRMVGLRAPQLVEAFRRLAGADRRP